MSVDSPLTCYICGKMTAYTVDMLGCLKNQSEAHARFKEKHGKEADGYINICDKCYKTKASYVKNVIKKYGIYEID